MSYEFQNFHSGSRDCHQAPNVLFCTNCHQNWMILC